MFSDVEKLKAARELIARPGGVRFSDYRPDDEDEYDVGDECGRWDNGRLGPYCALAGTEFCDFECPYRDRAIALAEAAHV